MARLLPLLAATCLAVACGELNDRPRLLRHRALNEAIVVGLPAELDPTSLTPRSVRLTDGTGHELRWRAENRGRELLLFAVLGVEEQGSATTGWRLQLAGFPSPHALRWHSGGVLSQNWSTRLQPTTLLRATGASPPRLVAVDGAPVSSAELHRVGPRAELELAGVFDPSALRAESFPLYPARGELLLDSVIPQLSARLVGEQTFLDLEIPPGVPELVLRTRDWECQDIAGRRLDPSVVIRLSRH